MAGDTWAAKCLANIIGGCIESWVLSSLRILQIFWSENHYQHYRGVFRNSTVPGGICAKISHVSLALTFKSNWEDNLARAWLWRQHGRSASILLTERPVFRWKLFYSSPQTVERDRQFQDMAERGWITFLMFMLHPNDYLEIRESSHVNHQGCSHTLLFVVGHYTYIQNLDCLFISILNQPVLTLPWEENWLGRGWGRHCIPASSIREINWALWWISAACRCFWEASSVKWAASQRFVF